MTSEVALPITTPEIDPEQKEKLNIALSGLLRRSSPKKPISCSQLAISLLGSDSPENRSIIFRVFNEVKDNYTSKGYLVGLKPTPMRDKPDTLFYVLSKKNAAKGVRLKEGGTRWAPIKKSKVPVEVIEESLENAIPSVLTPDESELLTFRLLNLRDDLRNYGVNIDPDNPAISSLPQTNGKYHEQSADQIITALSFAVRKIALFLSSPEQEDAFSCQTDLCQWLVNTCFIVSAFSKKGLHDLLVTFSEEEKEEFIRTIKSEPTSQDKEAMGNGKPVKNGRNTATIGQVPAGPSSPLSDIAFPSIREINDKLAGRRSEEIKNHDPLVDEHIKEILAKLGITDPTRAIRFFVPELALAFGIETKTIRLLEDDQKKIRRTGVKSKIDKRHPSFDIVESVWLGYLNGNHIKGGISQDLPDQMRDYIRSFLSKLAEDLPTA